MIENFSIAFLHNPIIGVLYIDDLEAKFTIEEFNENTNVYARINEMERFGFDFSCRNNILIIKDNAVKRTFFDFMVADLHLNTQGDFVAFFHVEMKNNILWASSLTLPDMYYLKKHLVVNDLNIII